MGAPMPVHRGIACKEQMWHGILQTPLETGPKSPDENEGKQLLEVNVGWCELDFALELTGHSMHGRLVGSVGLAKKDGKNA